VGSFQIAALLLSVCLVGWGVKHVSDPERLFVFRLGKPLRVAGPGVVFLVPLVDRGVRVNLDRAVPEWRSLDESQLIARLLEYVSQPGHPRP
jgi:regulator of protease activity HflC (stomatin/prohibitin superfamily)